MAVTVGYFFAWCYNHCTDHMKYQLLVTHHAPDLDAIGAVWMLTRFDAQHYAEAKTAFVNPGATLSTAEILSQGCEPHAVMHVDTGLGEFDHHQPERGSEHICATSLTYDHVCRLHPDLADDSALGIMSQFITEIDHFGEIDWPESGHERYTFMLHEILRGGESTDRFSDDHQMQYGLQSLDMVYAALRQRVAAEKELKTADTTFTLPFGEALALLTSNDDTIKLAQKQGYMLVIKKDPMLGHIRIKLRPDAPVTLAALSEAIQKKDPHATWYYHPSGKMLINGSQKHRNQTASTLSLQEVVTLVQELYRK